jgi:hypothetical protein
MDRPEVPGLGRASRKWRHWHLAPLAAVFLLTALSCGDAASVEITRLYAPTLTAQGLSHDPGMVHVHGLGIDDADGTLFVATHTGLYRVAPGGRPERVGGIMDLMGFIIPEPGVLLASGHPSAAMMQEQKVPPHLGLIRSTDGGHTWEPVSLVGEADFHVLRQLTDGIYGYNAFKRSLMFSTDYRKWEVRAQIDLYDLVAHPQDSLTVVASTPHGLAQSDDGGRQWRMQSDAPPIALLLWDAGAGLLGATKSGVMFEWDAERGWHEVAELPGLPEAWVMHGGLFLLSVKGGGIWQSTDAGRSWEPRVPADAIPLPR